MTQAALIARFSSLIIELYALDTHLDKAPGHSLCLAAALLLRTLIETLEARDTDDGEEEGRLPSKD